VRPARSFPAPKSFRRRAEILRRQQRRKALKALAEKVHGARNKAPVGDWFDAGAEQGKRLHQFEKYAIDAFDVPALLRSWHDGRQDPLISTFDVVNSVYHAALLRMPSINALEGNLKEPDFQCLLGYRPTPGEKVFAAEPIVDVLDTLGLGGVEDSLLDVFWKAERNKVFREGWHGGLRLAAIDGWEPYCSYLRHCDACLTREIEFGPKQEDGTRATRTQYYHRYVVAFLVGPTTEVILGLEPLRNRRQRIETGEIEVDCDEGEETAAKRLLDKLHIQYGTFIDAFLLDGLYADGPFFTKVVKELKYSAFVVLKNAKQQPLKFAEEIFALRPPTKVIDEPEHHEHVELWDIDNVRTMPNYDGPVRVVKAVVTKTKPVSKPRQVKSRQQRRLEKRQEALRQRQKVANKRASPPGDALQNEGKAKAREPTTWCVALVGEIAKKVSARMAHRIIRGRWHIEDTLFHQWVTQWNIDHVYRHTANALMAILLIWALVFNLMQYFLFRRLKRNRDAKDPTDTIRHIVEVMQREVGALTTPVPWELFTGDG
jgi:hypothetical protein